MIGDNIVLPVNKIYMDIVFLIGRILFGGYFLMMGFNHFRNLSNMTGYAQSKKVPSPKLAVVVGGLFITLGGIGIILGVYTKLAVWLLAIFLIVVAFKMHDFWKVEDQNMKTAEMQQFLKNIALAGAALMFLTISSWPLSL